MRVDIVGEDSVTQEVIVRLINEFRNDLIISTRLPARGGQIKNLAPKYNKLEKPIIMITDLDTYDCPPSLIDDWFEEPISPFLLFRIAYGETESWLMSNRDGFANWLDINVEEIPEPEQLDWKNPDNIELRFDYKPSLFMMLELASKSTNQRLKEMLTPREGAKKGPAYNSAILPFIQNYWDVKEAMKNSYSLNKAVQRLLAYNPI